MHATNNPNYTVVLTTNTTNLSSVYKMSTKRGFKENPKLSMMYLNNAILWTPNSGEGDEQIKRKAAIWKIKNRKRENCSLINGPLDS